MTTYASFSSPLVFVLAVFVIGLLAPSKSNERSPKHWDEKITQLHSEAAISRWKLETARQYETETSEASSTNTWKQKSAEFETASNQTDSRLENERHQRDSFVEAVNHPFRRPSSHWILATVVAFVSGLAVPRLFPNGKNESKTLGETESGKIRLGTAEAGLIEFPASWLDTVDTRWTQSRKMTVLFTVVFALGIVAVRSILL